MLAGPGDLFDDSPEAVAEQKTGPEKLKSNQQLFFPFIDEHERIVLQRVEDRAAFLTSFSSLLDVVPMTVNDRHVINEERKLIPLI